MKYYVVSSSELSDALSAKYHQGLLDGAGGISPIEIVVIADKAEAECRARRVVEDAQGNWVEVGGE